MKKNECISREWKIPGLQEVLRIMKLTVFLLLLSVISVFANKTYSQTKVLNLDMKNSTVKEVLRNIEKQSEFVFMYSEKLIDVNREVSVNVKNKKINEVLDELFAGTDVSYKVKDRFVLLTTPEVTGSDLLAQQQKSVTGKVTDSSGSPLPGVTVVIKGTTQGTITNADGEYSLTNISEDATLQFSFVGMQTQDIEVGDKTRIDVAMVVDAIGIEEVVAIGYGTRRKSDLISSVSSVDVDDINKIPSSDVGEMLRGKVSGVYITTNDAGPGGSSNILIRGKRSINGGNDPIVIADGVPLGSINDVNPSDILSMEILKDAAAQAIYGARASNGVILITTKRGKAGVFKVDYNGYHGVQKIVKNFDVYSGEEFADLKREAFRTDNNNNYLPDEDVFTITEQEVLASGQFINWFDEIFRLGSISDHNLNLSTGNEKTQVYSSLGYFNQEGVVPGTDYQRLNVRINADQQLKDWLKVGINTLWQYSKNNDPGTGGTLRGAVTTSPLGKIYNEDGSYKLNPTDVQESFNPLLDLATVTNVKERNSNLINFFTDITPFKGFQYRINASRRAWYQETLSYQTSESLGGVQSGYKGNGSVRYENDVTLQLENILTYDFDFKDSGHKLNSTFIQSLLKRTYNNFLNSSSKLPNDVLGIYGLQSAEINTPEISAYERSLTSFAARVQYDFKNKYYLTGSIRADGSSVFGRNNKWGFFPAIAAGWNIHNELFLKNSNFINNLKLRGSYGSVGNEAIDPYQSQSTAVSKDYLFNNSKTSGYAPGNFLPNPDLRWETSTMANVALDFGFIKNRYRGTLEIYNTSTTDLLVNQALNAGLGYTRRKTNIGEIENKGIELFTEGTVISNKDFNLNVGVTFSTNRNRIVSLYGLDKNEDGIEDDDVGNGWFIGHPIDVYYRFKYIGIFQEDENNQNTHQPNAKPGDIKLYDRNPDDGELNGDDRVITKQEPDWYGSLNLNMTFKSIDFSASLNTTQGVFRDNKFLYEYNHGGALRGIFNGIKQNYWTPENPAGNWPRPSEVNNPLYMEALGLQDASFVRLHNITLGYSLPDRLLRKMKFDNLRIYVTGQNLITWTDFQSYSPDKEADEYPVAASFTGGIQFGF